MPSPSYSSPLLDPTVIWFWDNSFNAVNVRLSAVDINTMTISKEHVFQPGLIFGASMLSPPDPEDPQGYVVLAQEYGATVLTKYSLSTWDKIDSMSFNKNTFALSGINHTAAYLQVGDDYPSHTIYSQCDFSMWVCGLPLNITYSTYAAYPGNSGWPASGFSGSLAYFVLQIQQPNDDYISIIHQVQLGDVMNSPKLVDTVRYDYEYSHNLLVTPDWVYTDTDVSVISRVRIQM